MKHFALIAAFALGCPAQAETAPAKAARLLSALTPDTVASRVTLKDDDLEANAVFTTQLVYQEKKGTFRLSTG